MKEEKIKSYKGFNQDMTCRGFQYEVGKEYETSKAECCQQGFHGCESPLEVLGHYFLDDECRLARFAEVEQSGKLSREDGSTKVASTKIKINAELNLAGLIKAGVEWIKEKSALDKDDEDKDYAQIGSSGDYAQIGSSGDYAKIDSTGEDSVIMCAGIESRVKAKKGSWITLAEWKWDNDKNRYIPVCVKTEYVDCERIKADTWYMLKCGEFVEC
jgi:hypothetical protein